MTDDLMPEDEVQKAILQDSSRALFYKSYLFLVVGVDTRVYQGKRAIKYSLARYDRDMKYVGHVHSPAKEERPHWFGMGEKPTKSIYDLYVHNITDEDDHLVLTDEMKPQPHRLPDGKWEQSEQFVEKLRRTPLEMMSEYDRSILKSVEEALEKGEKGEAVVQKAIQNPEENFHYPGVHKWFGEGKTLLFRQPTGLYYTDDDSLEMTIVKTTVKIRDVLWSLNLKPLLPQRRKQPYHNINPEALHKKIQERLSTLVRYLKTITANHESLTSGFATYKVAVIEPRGLTSLYDSLEEAMQDVILHEQVDDSEDAMRAAASLTKEEAKILVQAANVLDDKVPLIAKCIDSLLTKKDTYNQFSKADLAAALLRVANRLDEQGETELANTADKLLQSLDSGKD